MDLDNPQEAAKLIARLLPKVRIVADGCWEWQAGVTPAGYGKISSGSRKGKTYLAHRLIYELLVEPIPEGLSIDHLCRNRACVRPDHLEPVTTRENILRGATLAAENIGKTHCISGHAYTLPNTYYAPDGSRMCRVCSRANYRRRYAKARESAS